MSWWDSDQDLPPYECSYGYGDPNRCNLRTNVVGGGTDSWGCHKHKDHTTGKGGKNCSTHADCGFRFGTGHWCGKDPGHDDNIHEV